MKKSLIARMEKVLDNEGCDGMEVSNEVGVVAAYAFFNTGLDQQQTVPILKSQLIRSRVHVEDINKSAGYEFFYNK